MPPQGGSKSIEIQLRAKMDASQARREMQQLEQEVQQAERRQRARRGRPVETEAEYRRRADAYLEALRRSVDRPAKREGIPVEQAWEIAREEERKRRERDLRMARQQERAAQAQERAQTRLVRVGTQAMLPLLNAMTAGFSSLSETGNRAMSSLNKLNTALAGMQMAGSMMGGRLGGSLMGIGFIGTIATSIGMAVAQAVDAVTTRKEQEAEEAAARTAAEEAFANARRIRWEAKWGTDPLGLFRPDLQAAERAAREWEKRGQRLQHVANVQSQAREARQRAEAMRRANLTPEEQARETADELRSSAAELRKAAADLLTIEKGSQTALRMQEQANDLERRANELLEDIAKNTQTWAEGALEVIGGGGRLQRALSLSELQGGRRTVTLNFSGITDEVAAALARRFGPMIWDALRQLGYLPG
jgi:hypothetical protein